jgi:hypothetical protein
MKRLNLKVLLISSVTFMVILGLVYTFLNEWNISTLTYQYVLLAEKYIAYILTFISTPSFEGTANLVILSGVAFGLLIGLVAFIRGLIVRRPLSGFMAFLAINAFFAIGVSLIIINPNISNDGSFIYVLINGLSSNFIYYFFTIGILGFILLSLLMIFLLGITMKAKVAKKVSTIKLTPTINQPIPVQPTLQPATVTPNAPSSNDSLSELVKVVMQEELNLMRNTQQIYPNQALNQPSQVNPYASNIDVQLVRRIVAEEVAKYQGQFVSRSEVQNLIAQEILMIKSQLKIK